MRTFAVFFFSCSLLLVGQSSNGELRLRVTDPSGLAVKTSIQIVSEANQYRRVLGTDDEGVLTLHRLPFGVYQIQIRELGFAEISQSINLHSSIPTDHAIHLKLAGARESVTVTAANTLIDPDQAGSVNQIGSDSIQNRVSSIPGRSIQDLVNSQPGWLYEGNAVLHPRDSEYQTQFVVDGIPLTDNRSPSFGPQIEADDVESVSIYTAGFPAEYGRKMGGVVEVNTLRDSQSGFHRYLLAEDDRMFSPKTQRFVADRMGAQVRAHHVDHAPQTSEPATRRRVRAGSGQCDALSNRLSRLQTLAVVSAVLCRDDPCTSFADPALWASVAAVLRRVGSLGRGVPISPAQV